jgi:hypothetical protein
VVYAMEVGSINVQLIIDSKYVEKEDLEEIRDWLLESMGDDHTCDNLRIALKGNLDSEEEYNNLRESGCCGRADHLLTVKSGRKYLVGYNYGH